MNCELCALKNPKATVTAIVIQDGKLLLVKRTEQPYKGEWDFVGGYMQANELPEQALAREIKEELNCNIKEWTFITALPGIASWKKNDFPILSHFYLVELEGSPRLNSENSEYKFIHPLKLESVAFDSNNLMLWRIKDKFVFNLRTIKKLVSQLDTSAIVHEQSLYKAILCGYVATEYEKDKLIGMGWIFPRQTLLRKQYVVEDMIVDYNYRGRGIGRKILRKLIKWAEEDGGDIIELTTNPKRVVANELYKSEGFKLHITNHYLYEIWENREKN